VRGREREAGLPIERDPEKRGLGFGKMMLRNVTVALARDGRHMVEDAIAHGNERCRSTIFE
jgi:ribosomal protein S18 acetylase RimI-like enzyme